ncbi:hypothetical protein [Pseudonocardia sp. DLS-67]
MIVLVDSLCCGLALSSSRDTGTAGRTVEWIRDHAGSAVIDFVENIVYARPPSAGSPDPASLPAPPTPGRESTGPAPLPTLLGSAPLPGEGAWSAGPAASDGIPAIYTTFARPTPEYPSVVAGVAYLDQRHVRIQFIAGTREPGGVPTPEAAVVPQALRPSLVATFNSGSTMAEANGAWINNGNAAEPLRSDAASLVVRKDGSATVGRWGSDVVAGPNIAAVRQNLQLIVDRGQPVPGLDRNAHEGWGSAHSQRQYTWRSGIGVTAAGGLVYVAGANMDLVTLAAALAEARAIRGMQLDIHPRLVDLFTYHHDSGRLTAQKLLPDMRGPSDRYLVPDHRDFFVVTLR